MIDGGDGPAGGVAIAKPGRSSFTVVLALALFAAAFVSSPLHLPLNNPNEGVRVFAARAIVEQHTTAIDAVVRDWGYIDDKSVRDGHLYSSKAPLVTLLAAAAYAVVHPLTGDLDRTTLTRFCRLTGSVLPTALVTALAFWALRRRVRDRFVVDVAMVGLVTGTGLLASLHVFSGHALVAAIGAALTALTLLNEQPSRARLVVVGALVSLAACAEYPAFLLSPLAAGVVRRAPHKARAFAVVVAAAVVFALPTLVVHTLSFGAPWRTGYSFLENAQYRPLVAGTFMGTGLPDVFVLGSVLFSPAVGLFFFAPVTLLGALALPRLPRRDRVIVVVVVVAFLLFISGFRGWRGGWSVGPRYISELWGVLVVVAAVGLDGVRPHVARPVLVGAVAVGCVHSGVAGALFPHLPDLLKNPVGEMVVPLVVRGIAPDSVPLALGLSPATSVVVILVVLGTPLLLVALREPITLVGFVVVPAVIVVDLALPGTNDVARAREVRRALDNWRPEQGVPYLDDGADDPRVRFAVDRGRLVQGLACPVAPRPRRPDVGPGAAVLERAQLPDVGLVIVSDALADAIAPHGGGAYVVTIKDATQFLRAGLPCEGDVVVVARTGERPPEVMRAWRIARDDDLGDGWRRQTYARPASSGGASR